MNFILFENFILFITGLIGIVIISLILFSIKSNKLVNLFLVLIIALASFRMIIRSSFLLGLQDNISDFIGPYKSLLLYSLHLFYLYFKAIIYDYRSFQRKADGSGSAAARWWRRSRGRSPGRLRRRRR